MASTACAQVTGRVQQALELVPDGDAGGAAGFSCAAEHHQNASALRAHLAHNAALIVIVHLKHDEIGERLLDPQLAEDIALGAAGVGAGVSTTRKARRSAISPAGRSV